MGPRRLAVVAFALVLALPALTACATAQAAGLAASRTGSVDQRLLVDGRQRSYRLHLPPGYRQGARAPLILAFHGRGGDGAWMEHLTGLSRLSDTAGFDVAYPDGLDKSWHYGSGPDDVAFVDALLAHLRRTLSVDDRRIYATGISDGGFFSQYLACRRPGALAAIAPVAASLTDGIAALCAATPPLPVAAVFGTADPIVPWAGKRTGLPLLNFLSAPDSVAFWARHDGCAAVPSVQLLPDRDPADGTRVRQDTYRGCRPGTEVVFYAVLGGGHTWPGGAQFLPAGIVGRTSRDVDASQRIWDFFAQHPRS